MATIFSKCFETYKENSPGKYELKTHISLVCWVKKVGRVEAKNSNKLNQAQHRHQTAMLKSTNSAEHLEEAWPSLQILHEY